MKQITEIEQLEIWIETDSVQPMCEDYNCACTRSHRSNYDYICFYVNDHNECVVEDYIPKWAGMGDAPFKKRLEQLKILEEIETI